MLASLETSVSNPLHDLRERTRRWHHVVEHLRPRLTFNEIYHRIHPRPAATPADFKKDIKQLVASGDISSDVLGPTKRYSRQQIVEAVRRARDREPECTIYTLVNRLEEAAIPPLDQIRWTPKGIARVLARHSVP